MTSMPEPYIKGNMAAALESEHELDSQFRHRLLAKCTCIQSYFEVD